MSDESQNISQGAMIAGGAIATALLEVLFDKGILTLDDGRAVLDRAMKGGLAVHHNSRAPGSYDAAQTISRLMAGKFSARSVKP